MRLSAKFMETQERLNFLAPRSNLRRRKYKNTPKESISIGASMVLYYGNTSLVRQKDLNLLVYILYKEPHPHAGHRS